MERAARHAGNRSRPGSKPGGLTIGRGRFQPHHRETGKRLRINHQINISPVRLIDENDQQVGVVDLTDALRRAREAGSDLVEVAPLARPPVCKLMDYGKWKYQQKKKEQKAKSHSKQSELKEVRLGAKIDDHDLSIKIDKARDFLGDGDKVQFTMIFRGREMAHREIGLQIMHQVRDALVEVSKVESDPRTMGRRMTMVLSPERKSSKPKPSAPAPGSAPGTPASGSSTGTSASTTAKTAPTPAPASVSANTQA
ncbi:MAG: translation initiation factor IF-3 [Phycisphaeraceae bacterium]|nr:translation initiation factor IF-3 [Phycisphaeraceae bacterium]